jgi:tRNA A37 threonylcarbamoyladenosine dehydratase
LSCEVDLERRFGGVSRLYGAEGLAKLQAANACVIGVGGVGSWAAEALARSAVGTITLIDLDNIAESNVNRQIHALEGEFGKAKVSAMRERILSINPKAQVHEIEDFVTSENVGNMLSRGFDIVLDAIDDVKAKVAIANYCRANKIALITTGGAGGRLDATKIKVADLSAVQGDKLLAKVRNLLRRDFNFPKASNTKKSAKFGIQAVYSDEQTLNPEVISLKKDATGLKHSSAGLQANIHAGAGDAQNTSISGLNCAGYGSSVCVTAPFGFAAAGLAIQHLLSK